MRELAARAHITWLSVSTAMYLHSTLELVFIDAKDLLAYNNNFLFSSRENPC